MPWIAEAAAGASLRCLFAMSPCEDRFPDMATQRSPGRWGSISGGGASTWSLTQKEVARKLGVSHKTYEYWEQGRTAEPAIRHFPAIVLFLGYDPAPADPTFSIGERCHRSS